MIKLISQFDNEKTRLSLATPTCCGGCCCCCCCCLVSTIAVGNISARNFGKMVREEFPEDDEKIKKAKHLGFAWPIGAILCVIVSFIIGFNLINSGLAYKILPLTPDLTETIFTWGIAIVAFILFQKIFIKQLCNITNKKDIGKEFTNLSILWIIMAIVEGVIAFMLCIIWI